MQKPLLVEAVAVKSSPADLGIMARGILDQLRELKQDPKFLREFEEWKAEKKRGEVKK